MKTTSLQTMFFVGLCFLFCTSLRANGRKTGEPTYDFAKAFSRLPALMDTVPANNQAAGGAPAEKKDDLIKEVPKARKQDKPIAVIPVTVKPVLVKPKVIIKPIIKIH